MLASHTRFGLFNTEARILHSRHTGEDYQIGIWLPFSYPSPNRIYPVLYVLDGDYTFGLATGLIPTLIGGQEIPEMLVVGIAYASLSDWSDFSKRREQDLRPPDFEGTPPDARSPQFITFLKQELFPLIETEYGASSEDRGVYGFSAGGLFALSTLLTEPGLFRRTIAASCTWPGADAYLLTCEQQYADRSEHPATDLYFAVGSLDEGQLPGFEKVTAQLMKRNYSHFKLRTEIFQNEGHSAGVIARAFLNGLRSVFQDEMNQEP